MIRRSAISLSRCSGTGMASCNHAAFTYGRGTEMAPRTATDESMETTLLEQVVLPGGSNRPLDERAAILAHLRETSPGIAPKIDGFLLERIARLQDAMSAVEGQQDGLRRLIDDLT